MGLQSVANNRKMIALAASDADGSHLLGTTDAIWAIPLSAASAVLSGNSHLRVPGNGFTPDPVNAKVSVCRRSSWVGYRVRSMSFTVDSLIHT